MQYLQFFFIPFFLSLIFTPLVRILALKKGFVSYPRADRWHKHPTALLGGASIYLAFLIAAFLVHTPHKNVLGLLLGGSFLFIVGLADDKFHLKPYTKLFSQIAAGCIAVSFGVIVGLPTEHFLSIPITLLWIVGITNSFNLLDNLDGLAAGIAAIASLLLFVSSLLFSNNPLGIYGLIISGTAIGFLPYNFNPAKIFMGDSGSMFLGFSIAVISVTGTARHISNLITAIIIPVLILSVPIFDTLFVMVLRKLQGKKVFEGGKDHTSHHLVVLGLSQRKTVILLYTISIVFGLIAISYSRLNVFIISVIAFLAVVILVFFGMFLNESASAAMGKGRRHTHGNTNNTMLASFLLYKRRAIELLIDMIFVWVAYSLAYFLRFEGSLLPGNLQLMRDSLAWIILIKLSIFFIFGLYRGLWRYASIADLLTIFKTVSVASVASILFLTFVFRFKDYSRTVIVIDWLVLLFLVSASRISFRVLGEFFSRIREKGKNVLIFGAGDTGEMVMREIIRNKTLNYNPVGFIDDNPAKSGIKIQGVKVLGTRNKIKAIARSQNIEELLIAIPSLDVGEISSIIKICKECGLPYKKIRGLLDKEETDAFRKN